MKKISGWGIRRLMRIHKMTIRQVANRMNITLKRVREVRLNGVSGNCMCLDWYEAITSTGIYKKQTALKVCLQQAIGAQ